MYSCLWELSGSVSDPIIRDGEWPEYAARSWRLPDCEDIKRWSEEGVRTVGYKVRIGHLVNIREIVEENVQMYERRRLRIVKEQWKAVNE